MKFSPYILTLTALALSGCDFGEDAIVDKVRGDTNTKRYFRTSDVVVTEGGTAEFTLTFNQAADAAMTVQYSTSSGTAIEGTDFTGASGTLTVAAGETQKTISVQTTDDATVESAETFRLVFLDGTNFDLKSSPNQVWGRISDNDTPRTLAISSAAANEGSALSFQVNLSASSSHTITVDYATANGTATIADSDYTATSGTLSFAPGETTKTITVNTTTDSYHEADENITVTLSGGTNYETTGSTLSAVGTITNDDSAPTITFANASATEGNAVAFTVNLSTRSYQTITIDYATSDSTATIADSDYTTNSGTLTYTPGQTSKNISVTTTADTTFEPNEAFNLTLSGGSNYTTIGSTLLGIGTITNNDSAPTISINSVSANEGTSLGFTVTLSNLSYQTVTVNYATADGTALVSDSDYAGATGTLSFSAGQNSLGVTVVTTGDAHYEANETLSVMLSGGNNYTVAGSTLTGTGTITNEDTAPMVAISNTSAAEGSNLAFTVALSERSYQTITVNYATADGTGTNADTDYTPATGTLTFTPGDQAESLTVATSADTKFEADETLTVTLSGGSNYTSTGSTFVATGTITNNDATPTISVNDASANEGGSIVFTVTQDRISAFATSFDYATASGTGTSGVDFTAGSATATIAAGATTTTITVPALEDAEEETEETFTVNLTNPVNATVSDASGTGTIADLALFYNFLTGALPAQTTFARGSTAAYVNAAGTMVSAAANGPRFDHDPTNCPSGVCALKGLLIEPASTNLIINSAALNSASWLKVGLKSINANGGESASPDGVNSNAELLREDNSTSEHTLSYPLATAVTAGSLVHFTIYARQASNPRNFVRLKVHSGANLIQADFDLTGGDPTATASGGNGGGQLSADITEAGNGWQRLRLSGVASTTDNTLTTTVYLQDSFGGAETYLGDDTSGINLWGAQLEANTTVATSYIATGASTVTRAGESLSSNAFTGFSGAFGDGTSWTMITDFSRPRYEHSATSALPRVAELCLSSDCENNRIGAGADAGKLGGHSWITGAHQGGSLANTTPTADSIYQLGVVKNGSALQAFLNGVAATASGAIAYPSVNSLYVGGSEAAGTQLYGHLRKFTLRPRAVPNAQMLLLTND